MTGGHNIVAETWAGAYDPDSHLNPYLTHKHTLKAGEYIVARPLISCPPPHGPLREKAEIWASRIRFGSPGLDLGLGDGI